MNCDEVIEISSNVLALRGTTNSRGPRLENKNEGVATTNAKNMTEVFEEDDDCDTKAKNHNGKIDSVTYKCTDCSFQTIYKRNLLRHSYRHKPETLYCPRCYYRAADQAALNAHVHDWLKCSQCPFETVHLHSLKRHALCHKRDEAQTFGCVKCPYRTTYKANLKRHINSHH